MKKLYAYNESQLDDGKVLREAIEDYIQSLQGEYEEMPASKARYELISEYNYHTRGHLKSCRPFGFSIAPGDVCYIDFGKAYISEAGYQHFGLVMTVFCGKAFVIPMTSNPVNYQQAYDAVTNPFR